MKSQTSSSIKSIAQTTFSANSSSKKSKRRRSRRSGKLKKQEKIRRLVVNYGSKNIPISFKQIASKVGCTETYAKVTIAKLVKAGKIIKTATKFISKKYTKERVLCGKNLYTVPKPIEPKSPENSDAKINPKTPNNSSKEELANGTTHRNFSKRKNEEEFSRKEKLDLLKRYNMQDLVDKSPDWWFRDLKKLKQALQLTRKKIKKKYSCRDQIKFITFLLKHGVFGYRRHCARNLSLAINKPTLDRITPYMASPFVANGYESLKELYKKHSLDLQFTNIQKLLRKGFSHLAMSADVMIKRLKLPGVQNTNAFLHHIVSMKEPVDILRKKTA
jgi:DNA-binding Lrp family transcriptional regulator